ncbi:MAG: hypothetical protein RR782_02880 [Clostridium sp.]
MYKVDMNLKEGEDNGHTVVEVSITFNIKSYSRCLVNKLVMAARQQQNINEYALECGVSPRIVILAYYHKRRRVRRKNYTRILKAMKDI